MPTQVIYWAGRIKPEDRNSRNTSDGAVFVDRHQAERFAKRVIGGRGKIIGIYDVPDATGFWMSPEEMDEPHTADEIAAISKRRVSVGAAEIENYINTCETDDED